MSVSHIFLYLQRGNKYQHVREIIGSTQTQKTLTKGHVQATIQYICNKNHKIFDGWTKTFSIKQSSSLKKIS